MRIGSSPKPFVSLDCDRDLSRERAELRAVDENAVASSWAGPAVGVEIGAYKPAVAVVAAATAAATVVGVAISAAVISLVAVWGATTPISAVMAAASSTNTPPLNCDGNGEFMTFSLDRYVDDSDKLRHGATILEEALKLRRSECQSKRNRSRQRQFGRNRLPRPEADGCDAGSSENLSLALYKSDYPHADTCFARAFCGLLDVRKLCDLLDV